ncbi:trihelix transcription factor ASR3-like [Quillaja saponaria]|uniref:Trihelix transcription factor ASR3-like n=1 Tax=Quillaja saponaria TaxID=32244 RepID=A0AAD7LFC9_QUISA|nr:trihelix transcription factor ASR3-like [Quillaja saponaria]
MGPDANSDEKTRTRHPRWTRQETFILIQAKSVVENGGQRVRRFTTPSGFLEQLEPKWDSVSSLCRKHGVNRAPDQCRKRWSNLFGEFNKIKKWESNIKEEGESFWVMRNETRKEKKLPSYFDRDVYNVLDGKEYIAAVFPVHAKNTYEMAAEAAAAAAEQQGEDDDGDEPNVVYYNNNGPYAAVDDGLYSDSAESGPEEPDELGWSPEKRTTMKKNPRYEGTTPTPIAGTERTWVDSEFQGQPMSQEGRKRRRVSVDDSNGIINFEDQLIQALNSNTDTLKSHLGSHNINCQLDRDLRKEQTNCLLAALSELTDALGRIADKL